MLSLYRYIQYLWLMYMLAIDLTLGGKVELSIDTPGYPKFYMDRSINITCTASEYSEVTYVFLIRGEDSSGTSTSCAINVLNKWVAVPTLSTALGLTLLTDDDCESAAAASAAVQPPIFKLTMKGHVTAVMEGARLFCLAELDGRLVNNSIDAVTIPSLSAAPQDLRLTISGVEPKVVEGKRFTFQCTSTGADPPSIYRYEVYRGQTAVSNNNTYTPVEDDREGITLKCTDTVHIDLKDDVIQTMPVEPNYLYNPGEEIRPLELTPFAEYKITCDLMGRPTPTYSWECRDCGDTTTSTVTIPKDTRVDGDKETINCTASVVGVSSLTIMWTITWNIEVPVPTTTVSTPTPPGGSLWWIGLIIGVAVLTAVAVIVYCCCFRKRNAHDSTDTGSKATNGDVEKVRMTETRSAPATFPEKPKHQNSRKKRNAEPN